MRPTLAAIATAAVLSTGLVAGCGSDASTDVADATSTSSAEASTTTAADSGTGAGTVDANTASIDELAAAFEAAGIPQAERWAREVDEYRPYDTGDPTMAELRQELSKYNPGDEVLEAILATLTL